MCVVTTRLLIMEIPSATFIPEQLNTSAISQEKA